MICPTDPEVEPLFERVLGDIAKIHFIHGVPQADREMILGESDAVVSESCAPSELSNHGKFFLEHPFLDLPNFIGSPHVADHVTGMVPAAARAALENVRNFLAGDTIHGVISKSDYIQDGCIEFI